MINKKGEMKKDILDLISNLKNHKDLKINSIYKLSDLSNLEINIPINPYGMKYSNNSYITNFNNEYYACFDNGEKKICGYENALEITDIGVFNHKCEYSVSKEEAKIIASEYLEQKYNKKMVVGDLETITLGFVFWEYSGEAYPEENKNDKFSISIKRLDHYPYVNIIDHNK